MIALLIGSLFVSLIMLLIVPQAPLLFVLPLLLALISQSFAGSLPLSSLVRRRRRLGSASKINF